MKLKKEKTIIKKLELLREARNRAYQFESIEVICPQCQADIELIEIEVCEGCGAVICDYCLSFDYEGYHFCRKCYQSLKED